jgi:hypothetical protein
MDSLELVKVMSQGYNLPSQPKKVDVAHVTSKYNTPKQCFDNAYHYLDALPTNITDCKYVIGFMLFRGIPVEHAWVKVGDQYLDPTLTSNADHEYFSLAELDFMELIDVAAMCGCAPSIYDYSRWLRKNPKTIEVTEMSSSTVDDHIDTLLSQLSSEDAEMLASRLASVGYPGDVEMLSSENGASEELVQWAQSHGDPVSQEAGDKASTNEDVTSSSFGGDGTEQADSPTTSVAGWAGLYGSSPWVCVSVEIGQTEPVYNFFFDKADAEIFAGVSSEISSDDKVTSAVTESHMDWFDTKKAWTDECLLRFPSCKHYNVNSNRVDARSNRRVVGYFMKNRNGGYIEKAPATESIKKDGAVLIVGDNHLSGKFGQFVAFTESRTHAKVMVEGRQIHLRLDQLQSFKPDLSKTNPAMEFDGKHESIVRLIKSRGLKEATERTRTFVQFAVLDGNTVSASRSTVGKLEAGVYDITVDYNSGMPIYAKKSIKSDALLRFEDSRYNTVMEEVNGFWDMGPKYEELGYIHKRGFLMYGRPGVGKSCLSRLVIEDAVNKDCVVFFSKDFREAVKCIQTFREIEESRKVLFVFEDLDEILGYSEHSFLEFMDGEDSLNGCLVLATTNYPERLPERVLRAGRMDVKVEIHNPPAAGRLAYFKSKVPLMAEESLQEMVESTDDFSFAECREFLVNHLLYSNPIQRAAQLVKAVDRLRVESSKTKKQSLTEGFRDKTTGSHDGDKTSASTSKSFFWDGLVRPVVGNWLEARINGSWHAGTVKSDGGHYIDISVEDEDGYEKEVSIGEEDFTYKLRPITGLPRNGAEEATTGYSTSMSTNPTTVATEDRGAWIDKAGNKFDVYDRVTDGSKEYTVTGPISGVAMAFWCMDDEGNEVILDDLDVELVSKEAEAYEGICTDPGFGGTMNVPNVGTNEALDNPNMLYSSDITAEVQSNIDKAVQAGLSSSDPSAKAYAGAVGTAFEQYGLEGLVTQLMYLLLNLRSWKGDEARTTKAALNSWIKKMNKKGYSESFRNRTAPATSPEPVQKQPRVYRPFTKYDHMQHQGVIGLPDGSEPLISIICGTVRNDWDDEAFACAIIEGNARGVSYEGSVLCSEQETDGAGNEFTNDFDIQTGPCKDLDEVKAEIENIIQNDSRFKKFLIDNNATLNEGFRDRTTSSPSTSTKPGQRPAGDTKPWGDYDDEHEDNEPKRSPHPSDPDQSWADNLNGYELGERLKDILGQEFHVDSQDSQTVYIYFDGETDEEDELVQVEISDDGYYVGHARKGDYRLKDRENLKNSDEVADYIQDHMTRLTEGFRDKTASTGEPASKPTSGSARLTTTELVNELHWLLSSNYTIVDNGGPPTDGLVYVFRYGEDGDEDVSVEVQVSDDCYTLSHIRPGYGGGLDTKEVQTPKEIADYVTKRMMTEDNDMNTGDGSSSSSSSSDTQSDDEMLKNMSMHTDREDFEKKANELGVTIKKAPDSDYVYAYRDDQMVGEFDTKNNAGFLDQRDLEL